MKSERNGTKSDFVNRRSGVQVPKAAPHRALRFVSKTADPYAVVHMVRPFSAERTVCGVEFSSKWIGRMDPALSLDRKGAICGSCDRMRASAECEAQLVPSCVLVACPTCIAKPGMYCTMASGQPRTPHASRVLAERERAQTRGEAELDGATVDAFLDRFGVKKAGES